jgi:hypothetical protein
MNLKHNRSEICMPSPFHTNNNTIIVENYDNALGIIKQKLYDGEYFRSTDSSINIAEFSQRNSSLRFIQVKTLAYTKEVEAAYSREMFIVLLHVTQLSNKFKIFYYPLLELTSIYSRSKPDILY